MTGFYSAFIVAERRKEARELWENKFRKNAEKVYDLILEKIEEYPLQELGIRGFKKNSPVIFLLNYASRTKQLDGILTRLGTRKICADKDKCVQYQKGVEHIGCCSRDSYRTPDIAGLIIMQEIEAKRKGWENRHGNFCKYLSSDGCKLSLFKSPLCMGYLCSRLEGLLLFAGKNGQNFCSAMRMVKCGIPEIGERTLFHAMDKAIEYGNLILGERN
ncbi:hypothetical protein J4474_01010 [Candidatus Pacearchaeota archaeon]|nr:hypothetical protein [Candidatus Pacearchaeota archaeon]